MYVPLAQNESESNFDRQLLSSLFTGRTVVNGAFDQFKYNIYYTLVKM